MIKTASMHEMVRRVSEEYEIRSRNHLPAFTCYIVSDLFEPGAVFAWCKLLETVHPGEFYSGWNWFRRGWTYSFERLGRSPTQSRKSLFKTLLARPDCTLVWLEYDIPKSHD